MKFWIIIMILMITILLGIVIYLTWENRDSNKLVLKVLSFFLVGLLSIIITVLLQDKKEDIVYSTNSAMLVDSSGYPVIMSPTIDKKDDYSLKVLMALRDNNISINDKVASQPISTNQDDQFYFDLFTRSFISLFEELFFQGWYIDYKYNELQGSRSWGPKENVPSTQVSSSELNLYQDSIFNVNTPGIHNGIIHLPKGTKVSCNRNKFSNEIIFENKYFTYKIFIRTSGFHIGYGKYEPILSGLQNKGSSYYFEIQTICKFNDWYPNNPKIKKYDTWVKNTNKIIDYNFNSWKNFENINIPQNGYTRMIAWQQ